MDINKYLLNGGRLSSLEKEFDDSELVKLKFNDEWIATKDIHIPLKTLLALPNNSKKNYWLTKSSSRWQGLLGELGLNYPDFKNTKIYEQWIIMWNCTDTDVGLRAFYMENELVCIAFQTARKQCGGFWWVSKEAKQKVIDYLILLSINEKTNNNRINQIKAQIKALEDELFRLENDFDLDGDIIDYDSTYYSEYIWGNFNTTYSVIH